MTNHTNILELLREANPIPTVAKDDSGSERLYSAIVARRDASSGKTAVLDTTDRRDAPPESPARRRLRPALVFATAAVLAVAVLVPVLMLRTAEDVADDPTTTVAPTTAGTTTTSPAPTTTQAPPPATTVPAPTTPAPSPITWKRLPDQESLTYAFFSGVVELDGRLLAIGTIPEEGYGPGDRGWVSDGAAWTSTDGREWTRIPAKGLDGPGGQEINEIIETPDGLVILGEEYTDFLWTAVVWTSSSGEEWTKRADLGLVHVGARLETEDGWLIIGSDFRIGAQAWTTPDLVEWTPVSDPDFASASEGNLAYIEGGAETPAGFLAVGHDQGGDHVNVIDGYSGCAAAWWSPDGLEWERIGTEFLCEAAEILWDVFEFDGRWYVEVGNFRSLWLLVDPADPTTWTPVDEAPAGLDAACAADEPLVIDEVGFDRIDDGSFCATRDGGTTWETFEADAFAGDRVEIAARIVWNGQFIVLGQETVSAVGLPGTGVVWVGTIE